MAPNTIQTVVVESDGNVTWAPAMNFRTSCTLDLTHFPFDEHRCSIVIITWTHSEAEVQSLQNPSHSYGTSSAIWDHTVLHATRHK